MFLVGSFFLCPLSVWAPLIWAWFLGLNFLIFFFFFVFVFFFKNRSRRVSPNEPFDNQISDHSQNEKGRNDAEFCVNANPISVNVRNHETQTFPKSIVGKSCGLFIRKNYPVKCWKYNLKTIKLFSSLQNSNTLLIC